MTCFALDYYPFENERDLKVVLSWEWKFKKKVSIF